MPRLLELLTVAIFVAFPISAQTHATKRKPTLAATASIEGDVYLVMQSGDVKKKCWHETFSSLPTTCWIGRSQVIGSASCQRERK
jgi:hypothetical protein